MMLKLDTEAVCMYVCTYNQLQKNNQQRVTSGGDGDSVLRRNKTPRFHSSLMDLFCLEKEVSQTQQSMKAPHLGSIRKREYHQSNRRRNKTSRVHKFRPKRMSHSPIHIKQGIAEFETRYIHFVFSLAPDATAPRRTP